MNRTILLCVGALLIAGVGTAMIFTANPTDCDLQSTLSGEVMEECTCLGVKKVVATRQDQTKTVCIGIVSEKNVYE